jgi:hypothetical protein
LTVLSDGTTDAFKMVFCSRARGSVPLALCDGCGFGGTVHVDAHGKSAFVECGCVDLHFSPASDVRTPGRDPGLGVVELAAMLPVGISLARPIVCVADDASLKTAMIALDREASAYGVAVVDKTGRWLGVLPRARAALALSRSESGCAAAHMAPEWGVVDEGEALSRAFSMMMSRHTRELTVLDANGSVVGLLRDIEALQFVSHVARTGMRPPVGRE